ncbi:hypothetical protein P4H06_32160 [Bacillus cereus]|uniref:hypothetical protein n=1 Tax=Bacillus cereus group TaxID=86661 RepID=UPI002868FA92|nr:hypothetical protein [Bacillus thuringiensis]MEB8860908.1 hypothetical protein [Bacillus cereus]MEB9423123.1 hypothetical protein [Bacillus cereus]
MYEKVYGEFVSSIYELGNLKLSEEIFKKKQDEFNLWLVSLEEEKRLSLSLLKFQNKFKINSKFLKK